MTLAGYRVLGAVEEESWLRAWTETRTYFLGEIMLLPAARGS